MEMFDFKFDKPWYRQSELCEKLSMSNACLKRYMAEQLQDKKGSLTEMGYLKFEGFKEACWNPIKLVAWLIENKIEAEPTYDYELHEQRKVRMGILNFKKQQQQRKAI